MKLEFPYCHPISNYEYLIKIGVVKEGTVLIISLAQVQQLMQPLL